MTTFFVTLQKIILFSLLLLFTVRCISSYSNTRPELVNVYDDELKAESLILEGNELPSNMADIFNNKQVFLDPAKIIPEKADTYFVLRLIIKGKPDSFTIQDNDLMTIQTNISIGHLNARILKDTDNETIVYYKISPLKLIDISNSDSVKIYIYGTNNWMTGEFSKKNINNYKRFVKNYVLDIEDEKPGETLIKHAFLDIGSGMNNEIWAAHFFQNDLIKNQFFGVGFGLTDFGYKRYNLTAYSFPPIDLTYSYKDKKSNAIYMAGIMFGSKYRYETWPWDVYLAVTAQFYFPDNRNWDKYIASYIGNGRFPQYKYKIVDGKKLDGPAFGIKIQTGAVWLKVDTEYIWTTGISLPIDY